MSNEKSQLINVIVEFENELEAQRALVEEYLRMGKLAPYQITKYVAQKQLLDSLLCKWYTMVVPIGDILETE